MLFLKGYNFLNLPNTGFKVSYLNMFLNLKTSFNKKESNDNLLALHLLCTNRSNNAVPFIIVGFAVPFFDYRTVWRHYYFDLLVNRCQIKKLVTLLEHF